MKKVVVLAWSQIVIGVVVAAYSIFFSVGGFREQEIAIGKNLIAYSDTIEGHRKLVEVSGNNFFEINKAVSAVANGCGVAADTIKHIPYVKVAAPHLAKLHKALVEQYMAMEKSAETFPQTLKTLDDTRDNLRKIGNLLQNESPVNKVCMHVRFIGIVLAAMMIINGIVFCIIAKEKENC